MYNSSRELVFMWTAWGFYLILHGSSYVEKTCFLAGGRGEKEQNEAKNPPIFVSFQKPKIQ